MGSFSGAGGKGRVEERVLFLEWLRDRCMRPTFRLVKHCSSHRFVFLIIFLIINRQRSRCFILVFFFGLLLEFLFLLYIVGLIFLRHFLLNGGHIAR